MSYIPIYPPPVGTCNSIAHLAGFARLGEDQSPPPPNPQRASDTASSHRRDTPVGYRSSRRPLPRRRASGRTWRRPSRLGHCTAALEHRYNDAKYIWSDTSAREWLDGFVRAHDPTVPQAERRVVAGARARGALDGAHGPAPMRRIVIDLELEEGAEAARPILLD